MEDSGDKYDSDRKEKNVNGKCQMIIRKETKLDVGAISNITKLAFDVIRLKANQGLFCLIYIIIVKTV